MKPDLAVVRAIIPMLVCRDGAAEIAFCTVAFGAIERSRRSGADGTVIHATLSIGPQLLFIHGEVESLASRAPQPPQGSSPVVIYIYVDNADRVIEQAVRAGAKILKPAADQFWGDRVGRIIDPAGHVWNVAARIVTLKAP